MEDVFALDIGTRMVMGLIMEKSDDCYKILASSRTEHHQRAMYDGQVHDVEEVAKAVLQVKKELEKKTNYELTKVAVAAAGRALKTQTAEAERIELLPIRWEKEDVITLELEAVQEALKHVQYESQEALVTYHCVGYSIIQSWLEDQEISSLVGQRGRKARISVIATFLPRTVLDGLMAVLNRVGLEMQSLTLEPIAAGQVAIPTNMRKLNLAIVDIGAGTADIAITQNGSFFAYGMVPMAGDEITEKICEQYLLDFHVGEKIKREISKKDKLTFSDFFGKKITVSTEEVLNVIRPGVQELAQKLSEEILKLNNTVPQAVILIGGGSQTPLLGDEISEKLAIPKNRVGLQIRERINEVTGEKAVKGPDVITPIGIGVTALENQGLHYYSVSVNDISVPIFELQLATAAEALLAAGIQPRSFLGKPGTALTFELNNEIKVIKGSLGKPAQLLINGKPARLEQTLNAGDYLRFTPGIPGEDAVAVISDILSADSAKTIFFNGKAENYCSKIRINGKEVSVTDKIIDGCKIEYIPNEDLMNFLNPRGYDLNIVSDINIRVNGNVQTLHQQCKILVNNNEVHENCSLKSSDAVEIIKKPILIKELGLKASSLIFYVNNEEIIYPPKELKIYSRGKEINSEDPVFDGMDLRIEGFSGMPILSEILPLIKLPEHIPSGAKLTLTINGQPAEFTTILHPGDRITVAWY